MGAYPADRVAPGVAVVVAAGRYADEPGIVDEVTPAMAVVCLGRTGEVVRVRRDSCVCYD